MLIPESIQTQCDWTRTAFGKLQKMLEQLKFLVWEFAEGGVLFDDLTSPRGEAQVCLR